MYSSTKAIFFALFYILSANTFAQSTDEVYLAQAIYHESRGKKISIKEKRDIAKLVINRTKHKKFPKTISSVILQKKQFKWANNRNKIEDNVAWEKCQAIAKSIIKNPKLSDLPDNVVFFKLKSSKVVLAENISKIDRDENYRHYFYKIKG